ncbi:MAG: hypothetical protein R2854_18015 [Caldilineaceae bacterium]
MVGGTGTVATVIDPAACSMEPYPVTVELGVSAARSDRHRPAHARAAYRGDDWWTTSPAEVDVISPPWTRNAAARSCAAAWLRPG